MLQGGVMAPSSEETPDPEPQEDIDALMPQVYDELRRLAQGYLRRERPDHTLQPTALVHEAYLRLAASDRVKWENQNHFYCLRKPGACLRERKLTIRSMWGASISSARGKPTQEPHTYPGPITASCPAIRASGLPVGRIPDQIK